MLRTNWLLVALTYLNLVSFVLAQSPSPSPTPLPPHPPVGYMRVWDLASSLKQAVSISLAGGKQPCILSRALKSGQLTSYRELPVGTFKINVRTASKDLSISESEPTLIPPAAVAVADRSFQTLVLQDDVKAPKVFLINDSTIGTGLASGSKRLRIFNFAPGQSVSLKTMPRGELIAERLATGMSQHIFSASPGSVTLVMSNRLPNGHDAEQNIELNFASADSISAVIMIDPYSRLTLAAFEDATIE